MNDVNGKLKQKNHKIITKTNHKQHKQQIKFIDEKKGLNEETVLTQMDLTANI